MRPRAPLWPEAPRDESCVVEVMEGRGEPLVVWDVSRTLVTPNTSRALDALFGRPHARVARVVAPPAPCDGGARMRIVTEFLPGCSLGALLRQLGAAGTTFGACDEARAWVTFGELIDAVSYLHGEGIVLYGIYENDVVLAGSGGARLYSVALPSRPPVEPARSPPETRNDRPWSFAGDVWTLGFVFAALFSSEGGWLPPRCRPLYLAMTAPEPLSRPSARQIMRAYFMPPPVERSLELYPWRCATCGFVNPFAVDCCTLCGAEDERPPSVVSPEPHSAAAWLLKPPTEAAVRWSCPRCTLRNRPNAKKCRLCGYGRAVAPQTTVLQQRPPAQVVCRPMPVAPPVQLVQPSESSATGAEDGSVATPAPPTVPPPPQASFDVRVVAPPAVVLLSAGAAPSEAFAATVSSPSAVRGGGSVSRAEAPVAAPAPTAAAAAPNGGDRRSHAQHRQRHKRRRRVSSSLVSDVPPYASDDTWTCDACTLVNSDARGRCDCCGSVRSQRGRARRLPPWAVEVMATSESPSSSGGSGEDGSEREEGSGGVGARLHCGLPPYVALSLDPFLARRDEDMSREASLVTPLQV